MGGDHVVSLGRPNSCNRSKTKSRRYRTLLNGLENGGPAGLIYGYLFVWCGVSLQALVMAEMASMYVHREPQSLRPAIGKLFAKTTLFTRLAGVRHSDRQLPWPSLVSTTLVLVDVVRKLPPRSLWRSNSRYKSPITSFKLVTDQLAGSPLQVAPSIGYLSCPLHRARSSLAT